MRLHFFPYALDSVHGMMPPKEYCDFEKEPGKLWFRSPMIMNGVCCSAVGYLNLTKLDGTARLEFDPDYARVRVLYKWEKIIFSKILSSFILIA